MKKTVMILGAAMLLFPAVANAGYYGYNCQSASTMKVECTKGVKVYRGQALQYAPGQLQAMVRADQSKSEHSRLKRKLAMKSKKLKAQSHEIAKLEKRLETLEARGLRRAYSGEFITGVGLGAGFLSPQRVPGFNNGLISGHGNYGSRGRRRH